MSRHRRSASMTEKEGKGKRVAANESDTNLRTSSQATPVISHTHGSESRLQTKDRLLNTAFGVSVGVGKGVYGRAVGKGKKLYANFDKSSSCIKPGDPRYPKYNSCASVKTCSELQSLLCVGVNYASIFAQVGPEEGVIECANDLENRRNELKIMMKKLQANPNALQSDDQLARNEITLDEVKKKLANLKILEKKIKKFLPQIEISRRNNVDERLFGETIDTYAHDYMKGTRPGQPNADSFYAESFHNFIFFGVADGIGWGLPSRRASEAALLGFIVSLHEYYSKKHRGSQYDTVSIAQACWTALQLAHLSVHSFSEAKTTFCGGVIVELEHQNHSELSLLKDDLPFDSPPFRSSLNPFDSSGSLLSNQSDERYPRSDSSDSDSDSELGSGIEICKRWAFVGISVGDSLIYRYSHASADVKELTLSDRSGGVRDAGGHIGGLDPDLRNLHYHFCLVEEGDYLIAVSDGVHDNLDPEVLHVEPRDAGVSCEEHTSWANIPDDEKNEKKRAFKEERLLEIIESLDDASPKAVTTAVLEQIKSNTRLHRNAVENGSILQRDWGKMSETERDEMNASVKEALRNPIGKFDHVTCLTVEVGPARRPFQDFHL